jgi:uncharacterized tellurite resistance protein B-like protein
MRTYPKNSPEAAARLLALVLIADGHVCHSELDAMKQLDAPRELGLDADALPAILQTLCEDLLMGTRTGGSVLGGVDTQALASLMAEVDDPRLQRKVLRLALAAAEADGHWAAGEIAVLNALRLQWNFSDAAYAARTQ